MWKTQIFAETAVFRRKPQKTAGTRRKPQIGVEALPYSPSDRPGDTRTLASAHTWKEQESGVSATTAWLANSSQATFISTRAISHMCWSILCSPAEHPLAMIQYLLLCCGLPTTSSNLLPELTLKQSHHDDGHYQVLFESGRLASGEV